jgi:two-component system response regulator HydG
MLSVLIVDEDDAVRSACCEVARQAGFQPEPASSIATARHLLASSSFDIALVGMSGGGDLTLLEEINRRHPVTVAVVMAAFASVPFAVEAMRIGATDYLTKPFTMAELTTVLQNAADNRQLNMESRRLREHLKSAHGLGNLIGRSPEMSKLYRIISKVAQSSHPVLVLGESGTGKELVARAIHSHGQNAAQPFIPVDCGSLVPTLIESELFGYVKGAFTGATRAKDGLLVAAEGGTVFLDEIGELPLDLQSKLLRALQEKEVRPVGSTQRVPINVRVLAATNRNLSEMVEQGKFRKDLFFRLNVVNLRIPALRERRTDIPMLAAHFLDRLKRENGVEYVLSDDALRILSSYDWPGNVRELENCIERACALSSGPVLQLPDLPTQLQNFHLEVVRGEQERRAAPVVSGNGIVSIAELEKQAILGTIRKLNGDKLLAAKLLGIGKTTLYRKLKEYGIAECEVGAPA